MWAVMCVCRHVCHTQARSCLSTGWALNRCFAWGCGTAAVLAQGGGGVQPRKGLHFGVPGMRRYTTGVGAFHTHETCCLSALPNPSVSTWLNKPMTSSGTAYLPVCKSTQMILPSYPMTGSRQQ